MSGTTTVIPAPLTITATSGTMTYGGAVPVISPNVSGLQNGENVSVLGAGLTCTTTATPTSPVGSYPSSCSGATDPNYSISYVAGTVTRHTGGAVHHGVVEQHDVRRPGPGDHGRSSRACRTARPCRCSAPTSCARRAPSSTSPVGDYASACGGAVDANYTFTYVPGDVTVNPATLMITASSATVSYGTAPPAITASYSGFVNGDTPASLTTPPTCSTTATSSSPVGSYPSSCSGAVDPNYTISYLGGTVQVADASSSRSPPRRTR